MARRKKFVLISLRKKKRWRPKKRTYWKIFLALFLIFFIIPSIIGYMWFKKNILDKLPPVSNIEKVVFSQTTTITDRNGVVLYRVFDENRKYVSLDKISPNVQNAIIATEDKNFWENPWIDIKWIFRAAVHDLIFWQKQGGSTLTQQLIKNLILTREKTITRKLKEIVLSLQLNNYLENKFKQQYPNLTDKQLKQKVKEKILEMYLNYVFLGNNSYWVEAASETYFHKNASQLSILESAILASIPKSPVKYDPIKHRENNLWKFEVVSASGSIIKDKNIIKKAQQAYIDYLNSTTFAFANSETDILKILSKEVSYKNYKIKFVPGRADIVLSRMYIDGYITKKQLIQAIKDSFSEKIYSPSVSIKAPWFVFYVLEILNKKYWEDVVAKAWWTIKTSLDWKIQQLAQQSIKDYDKYLQKKWANNAALLYVDSSNGDILAYVGSKDYYNKEIDWQVDMIRALRQCGSVMKPLIYANAFIKNKWFTPDTPIYDVKFNIAEKGHTFNNFDWKFLGLLPIRKALPYSRNIPAAKMYYLWGWEYPVKKFLRSLWLKTISDKVYYGYPLAIGAADVTMLSMAQAYSNLSNFNPVKINPILEIKWPDWSLIYKKQPEHLPKIIPNSIVSFLWYILSNPLNRPPSWNYIMQIPGLTLATKSWTTNIIDPKTKRKYPRDGWFISYSPSKVFVAWAWNTDWKHMWPEAYWGWTAGKVWRDFVLKLKKAGLIQNENMPLKDTLPVYVNTLNWKKVSLKTPIQVSQKTIARLDWIPPEDDGKTVKMIQVDKLCNWKVSKYTPKEDIIYAYVIKPHSLMPSNPKWEEPVQQWWKTKGVKKYEKIFQAPVLLKEPDTICEDRKIIAEKWMLNFSIDWPKNNSTLAYVFDLRLKILNQPFPIKTIKILVDNKLVATYNYSSPLFTVVIPSNITEWNHTLTVVLIDEKNYKASKSLNINLTKLDTDKPFLAEIKQIWNSFIYVFKDNTSKVVGGYLLCWDKKIKFSWPIVKSSYKDCGYDILDYYGNETIKH